MPRHTVIVIVILIANSVVALRRDSCPAPAVNFSLWEFWASFFIERPYFLRQKFAAVCQKIASFWPLTSSVYDAAFHSCSDVFFSHSLGDSWYNLYYRLVFENYR